MTIQGRHYRTIWEDENNGNLVNIIDQRWLPHKFVIAPLRSFRDFVFAIKEMQVRGAPLIGVTAAYSVYFALLDMRLNKQPAATLETYLNEIKNTRPTAINLAWALERQKLTLSQIDSLEEKIRAALQTARIIALEDIEQCRKIGEHGVTLIRNILKAKNGNTVNILTHCNAGWLATVDYGTATAPIYIAQEEGLDIHVWVDETRPRNQGAKLTAFELSCQGIPHTVIADNLGGYLMQQGFVDLVIVGSDRVSVNGDVANKIGTYLKALSAKDCSIPFYAALPSSTIDWEIEDGFRNIPIELRQEDEVRYMDGLYNDRIIKVLITPETSPSLNYAFDVTPARLVTGLITERGICNANKESIYELYPEKKRV